MASSFEGQLLDSLRFGFVDRVQFRDVTYAPKILINNAEEKRFVLTDLQEELVKCQAFYFSVAFVTQSGISMIKAQLSDLALRGVCGQILISPYLGFNDPLAMYDLLRLPNVEVRISPEVLQLHSKYYLFEQETKQVLIAGSSNLTATALKQNYEWNIKLNSTDNGDLLYQTKQEFDRVWALSSPLSAEIIESYKRRRKPQIQISLIEDEETPTYQVGQVEPNKMQKEALAGLQNVRENGAQKALVISATGTGKTYLSAFDVRQVNPERVLFIVHREQILSKSLESFQRVLGFADDEACIYKAGLDISGKKYIFATIQTLSREEHLQRFAPDFFDYILIDEVHKAGAESYKKVMAYFEPDFLLGMTATPERTDGQNIYELFDYNIAYEIRLQDAMDADLLCPFHYFGVTDITVDGKFIGEDVDFSNLVSAERVNHIVDKIRYYGHSGEYVRGLMFCSSKNEAKELAILLNQRGFRTQALTGDDNQAVREEAINKLERGQLDYLLTVDIFNEGIDIPSVNQVVMLRNTESSIIFVQQLGRGLRKHDSKEYVTIIDFIGNYRNNYLIPVALFGDQSMNKDNYRREVREANLINGLTTINFEEVARKQIFESITNTSFSSMKILRDSYIDLHNKLGRQPFLKDFVIYNSIDPVTFFKNVAFKTYVDVVNKFSDNTIDLSKEERGYLTFLTTEVLASKRPHEVLLLEYLFENGQIRKLDFQKLLRKKGLNHDSKTLDSLERVLTLSFFVEADRRKYENNPLIGSRDGSYFLSPLFLNLLKRKIFYDLCSDVISVGLYKSRTTDGNPQIGEKYTRKEMCKLFLWKKDESSTVYGYKPKYNMCPIFVSYHKEMEDEIQYQDSFINEQLFYWSTRKNTDLNSKQVKEIIHSASNGMKLYLFINKSKDEGAEHYFMGEVKYVEGTAKNDIEPDSNEKVVTMQLRLETAVKQDLYDYITKK